MEWLGNILRVICIFFDCIIYSIATFSYVLFQAMCRLNVAAIGEQFKGIVERVQLFIGIIMLFVISFELLKLLVNPEQSEAITSKIVKKVAVVIVLLVSMNFIFDQLEGLQNAILDSKVVENLVMATEYSPDSSTSETNYESYVSTGKFFANELLFAFVNLDNSSSGKNLKSDINAGKADIWQITDIINDEGVTYTYPIISGACGILLILMMIAFAIDVGVRSFTLILLQIIAPIPVITYITPQGESSLMNFLKIYLQTYVQLFIKIFTSYVVLYLLKVLMQGILANKEITAGETLFPGLESAGTFFKAILVIVVMISLYMFAKKFPTLLKQIFNIDLGSDGSFNPFKVAGKAAGKVVRGGARLGGHLALAAGGYALGAATGGLGAARSGAGLGGVLKSVLRGGNTGAKNAFRINSLKDAFSNATHGTAENFRTQREYARSLGDQGGNSGARAQRKNQDNEKAIRQAQANMDTLNKTEELRKQMLEEVEAYGFKNNAIDSNSSAKNREEYVEEQTTTERANLETAVSRQITEGYSAAQKAADEAKVMARQTDSGYTEAQKANDLADVRAKVVVKAYTETDKSADIAAAKTALNNAIAAVNKKVDDYSKNSASITAASSVVGSSAEAKFNELKTHVNSTSATHNNQKIETAADIEIVHTDITTASTGLKAQQQAIITEASSNEVAVAAAQARARGAAHAAERNSGNNNGGR